LTDILFGTCGWSYAEWEGMFYPEKRSKLTQYSNIFPTVEIDSTFYALPNEGTVQGWARHTPPEFSFSAKLPQTITHKKLLDLTRGVEKDLNQFINTMKPTVEADKLAAILIQLPPNLRLNLEKLESFFSILPENLKCAVEFRHNSWLTDDAFKLLKKHGVAYTVVDEPLLPPDVHVTSDLAYIRWHGRGSHPWFNYKYSEEQLAAWIPKVKEASSKAKKVLGYFNNHFHGYAPENALQTMQMMGIVTPHATAALQRLAFERKYRAQETGTGTLDKWTGSATPEIRSLAIFADPATVQAARSIDDKDFSLREENSRAVAAYVGDTTVDIRLDSKTITHRCNQWNSVSQDKKFCPHIVILFLSINRAKAQKILSEMQNTLGDWTFQSRTA
jgi:uncharacterized protein YecE (DUF72 family)